MIASARESPIDTYTACNTKLLIGDRSDGDHMEGQQQTHRGIYNFVPRPMGPNYR